MITWIIPQYKEPCDASGCDAQATIGLMWNRDRRAKPGKVWLCTSHCNDIAFEAEQAVKEQQGAHQPK